MTAYVHIGKHKTGTTTIQNFMAKNYEILKEKGFVFAKSATFNNQHLPFVNTLNSLADAHEDIKLNYEDNWVFKAFKKEINENPNKIFIFSSEEFSLRSNSEKSVKILKEMLKKLGFTEIKIIIYLRNQADSMVSVSSQSIKHGHHPAYKVPATNDKNIFFNYKQAVSNYLNTFSKENLIVKLFDKNEFYEGDLIKDFLHILGLKLDDSFIIPLNQNETLDLIGFELGERIENLCKEPYSHFKSRFGLGSHIALSLHLQSKDPSLKFMPKKEIYESYITYFEESNEWVRKEFFPHKERLFPKKDLSTYKENYELKEMKPEYWDRIANFIVDFAKDRKKLIDSKDLEISKLKQEKENIKKEHSSYISSIENKETTLKLLNLEQDLINKKLNTKKLYKELNIKEDVFMPRINLIQANSAKARIHSHLAYKLGQALIENSKSIKGYIRLPYVTFHIHSIQ